MTPYFFSKTYKKSDESSFFHPINFKIFQKVGEFNPCHNSKQPNQIPATTPNNQTKSRLQLQATRPNPGYNSKHRNQNPLD